MTYGGVAFVIVHSVYQAGNAAERFRKNALTRRTYVRTFPKNTESLQSWSFSNRNDRKKILRILRGDIDFSKKKSTFWIWGILDLRQLTIFEIFFFQKFEKIIHRKSDSP